MGDPQCVLVMDLEAGELAPCTWPHAARLASVLAAGQVLVALLLWLFPALVGAQVPYPGRPITIVVPFAPGGPTDKTARDLALALRSLAVPVVVENVTGAGGTLGAARVARAAPDGYTLLFHHVGMATAPALYAQLPYTLEEFEYLGIVGDVPMTLVGRPTLPAKTWQELRAWLRGNASRASLAHAGRGSASHLCGLLLQRALQLNVLTVPYKGTAPAMTDLLGGQVDLMCDQSTNTSAQIASGRVRGFGVTSAQRLDTTELKGLPTLDELGLPGFEVSVWQGLYAPRGTPQGVLDVLAAALRLAVQDAEFVRRQVALGAVVNSDSRLSGLGHKRFVQA